MNLLCGEDTNLVIKFDYLNYFILNQSFHELSFTS